tara:strand:+ start:825 stop:956 length:132 start_codon:yes stop_codon:yes gene_type:complete
MYSTKEVRIILLRSEALLSFVRVCAQEKKRHKSGENKIGEKAQ